MSPPLQNGVNAQGQLLTLAQELACGVKDRPGLFTWKIGYRKLSVSLLVGSLCCCLVSGRPELHPCVMSVGAACRSYF